MARHEQEHTWTLVATVDGPGIQRAFASEPKEHRFEAERQRGKLEQEIERFIDWQYHSVTGLTCPPVTVVFSLRDDVVIVTRVTGRFDHFLAEWHPNPAEDEVEL